MSDSNLLGNEASPYLLQHADDPVHWQPWSKAVLAEAKRQNKPVLLSIGYATCHWCHVMAHESFRDAATAAQMNEQFICVKVDREERPDLDRLYMSALHVLGQQSGWPLTIFLLPDGTPFWGGTYFPPEARWEKPAFRDVLTSVYEAFVREGDKIAENAEVMRQALTLLSTTQPGETIDNALLDRANAGFLRLMDMERGGLRGAPKFPNAPIFRFLWAEYFRSGKTQLRDVVLLLLLKISVGGIWDHLGGGFSRYSTDADWLVPHFEKVLSDNAQLLELLTLVYSETRDPLIADRVYELVVWLARDMQADAGFAAAQDADSEGVEGKFYVWTAAEVDKILGADAPLFRSTYDITATGNWDGVNIPNLLWSTAKLGKTERNALTRAREKLFEVRKARSPLLTDTKVLTDWNGLMIAALARASVVFENEEWILLAQDIFADVLKFLRDADGRLAHAFCSGRVTARGILDDYACMTYAALMLFHATGKADYLREAIGLIQEVEERFMDPDGSFYTNASDADDVIVRLRNAADESVLSGNGLMAENYARLFHITGYAEWAERAQRIVSAYSGAGDALGAMPTLMGAASLLRNGISIVVHGAEDDPAYQALLKAARTHPNPMAVVLATPEAISANHPAYAKIGKGGTKAAAYVCRDQTCLPPIHDEAGLRAALAPRS